MVVIFFNQRKCNTKHDVQSNVQFFFKLILILEAHRLGGSEWFTEGSLRNTFQASLRCTHPELETACVYLPGNILPMLNNNV